MVLTDGALHVLWRLGTMSTELTFAHLNHSIRGEQPMAMLVLWRRLVHLGIPAYRASGHTCPAEQWVDEEEADEGPLWPSDRIADHGCYPHR